MTQPDVVFPMAWCGLSMPSFCELLRTERPAVVETYPEPRNDTGVVTVEGWILGQRVRSS